MKFPELLLGQVQEQVFIDAIDDFLDKFDFAVEDKGTGMVPADAHVRIDSGVGL